MTELEKMKNKLWYDANYNESLNTLRLEADDLCFMLNATSPRNTEKREHIMSKLISKLGSDCVILSPFFVDYGSFISIGKNTFINRNTYLMDGGGITIGEHCFIGPSCGFYTAVHPLNAEDRNKGLEKALPIVLGDNVWLGADVKIMPGVTIGSNTVIGAGSVVTKDIEANVLAMGNPCKVKRAITDADKIVLD